MSIPGDEEPVDVLIIGAGIAGLAAARRLAERNVQVLVLEAKDHVGGRVISRKAEDGGIVELGAEFVHGRAPELWALINEAGLETIERDGAILREDRERGGVAADSAEGDDDTFAPLDALADLKTDDLPFARWLETSEVPESQRAALTGYVEGFNAADAERISARSLGVQQKAEEAIEGDRAWHIRGGYSQLPEFLAGGVRELGGGVRLGCTVQHISWSAGRVELATTAGTFTAPKCIVTLPLGVLQQVNTAGAIGISPEPRALHAARRMAMGEAIHFAMVFRERWWEQAEGVDPETLRTMSFLFSPQRMPPVWWTPHPEPEPLPTLVGWVGGPRARALLGRSAGELGRIACRELAGIFRFPEDHVRAQLIETHAHDWSGDPFSRGAYSYVAAGALDAPGIMAHPENDTLFFAGEHTDTSGHWGTVHAALRTGLRAAAQVLGTE